MAMRWGCTIEHMSPQHSSDQSPTQDGQQHPAASLAEMIQAITSTFVIAHDGSSDEHLAQALVYNAGRLAWRMRETGGLSATEKTNVSDVVTEADQAAEQFITGALSRLRPEDGFYGEEGARKASTSGRTWVIDPIDGTWNFSSGSDYWCSALALVEGEPEAPDRLIFGAVHRPAMGYTWFGGPDIPGTRDGQPLKPLPDLPADHLCLGTYLHPTFMSQAELLHTWVRGVQCFATVRSFGAGSVDLASVADGTIGCWMQHSVPAWDWLPGKALIESVGGAATRVEAGGVTWSIAGQPQAVTQLAEALGNTP